MKVEPMSKEEITEFISERIRKRMLIQRIADNDNILDRLATEEVASLYANCTSCYNCLLVEYCNGVLPCDVTILTYLKKGVKGLK